VVPRSKHAPNIHTVGVPPTSQRQCQIRFTGRKGSTERSVDWQQGKALILYFGDDGVVMEQAQEPVMFQ